MRILLLAEGDAETRDCWSGSAKSAVDHLRNAHHTVVCGDVDLYGADRLVAALAAFSFDRQRWKAKYHLSEFSFSRRSAVAGRHIKSRKSNLDVVVQIGASNTPLHLAPLPYALYCDSNILLASHAAVDTPAVSDFHRLNKEEVQQVVARETAVYRNAKLILTMSERLRQSFIEDFELPPEKIHTIHAGPNFDVARIPPRSERSDSAPPTILFVGREFERKGGDFMLRVFARVRSALPNARLIVAGPSDLVINDPGVECLGFLDKDTTAGWNALRDAYASADVFCLPTRFEPFGIAYVEAMFFGLPCLGPNAWAVPELIRDGVTGYLAPVGDEQVWCDRLLELLLDRGKAAHMGQQGRQFAAGYFTWDATIERMMMALGPIIAK